MTTTWNSAVATSGRTSVRGCTNLSSGSANAVAWWRRAHSLITATWSSTPTCFGAGERSAATATERRHGGHRRAPAGLHRQRRLGAIERLALGLLVEAEHHRPLGRVHVEPDDVDELRLEVRVGRDLERVDLPRLELMIPPDPRHGVLADPVPRRHQPRRPVRRPVVGLGVQRVVHNRLHGAVRKPRSAAPTRRDHPDTSTPASAETGPPPAHRVRGRRAPSSDLEIRTPSAANNRPWA